MTSPALGGGKTSNIFSGCAINLEIGEIKVISKITKFNKFGMNMYNTFGIV